MASDIRKYSVVVTFEAKNDVRQIIDYIMYGLKNITAAHSIYLALKQGFDSSKHFPNRGVKVNRGIGKERGWRFLIVGNFNINYWVDDKNKVVYVLSVLYGKHKEIKNK